MKRRLYLHFLSNTTAITVQGCKFGVLFYDFATLARNIRGLNYIFADGVPDRENRESFVPRKFKRIRYLFNIAIALTNLPSG